MINEEKLIHDIEEIKDAINSLRRNVIRIERVLAHQTYIPAKNRTIKYSHQKRQLILDRQYTIQFEKNEADLMGLMFVTQGKRKGQPKTKEVTLEKIANDNKLLNLKPDTKRAVYAAFKRINNRILSETRIDFFMLNFNSIKFNEFARRNIEM